MSKQSPFIAAIVLAFAGLAQAATLTVTNTSDGPEPGPDGSMRRAISDAVSGDTIQIALPANSSVNLTSGELFIEKNLTISGPGANLLRVQRSTAPGTPKFPVLNIRIFNVTLSGLTVANGDVGTGGGIYNSGGTVNVTNSTISANHTEYGGGIYNDGGTVIIINSTISGNSAGTDGGGIYNSGGTVTIINSTISGNSAGAFGGGIYKPAGTVTISNSTISGNSSGSTGGGIRGIGGTLTARNTIIARNTAMNVNPDVDGTLTSQGYNLIGNTSGTTITGTTTGNQLNVDPKLGLLQDNGGPTFTHALLSGSTAIEGGNSFGSNTDQRGFPRPVDSPAFTNLGDGSDIGAYEVQADLLPGCINIDRVVHNNDDSGAGSLRAVIAEVCAGSTITFAPNVRGAINLTSGELLINKRLAISGPGAHLLTVQRSGAAGTPNFRIFNIIFNIAPASVLATISGLTISNGNTNPGGAGRGGGVLNGGTLTLTNSVISGNTTSYDQNGGGPANGGGVSNDGTLTLINSVISGNTASLSSAGGISNGSGTLTIINSTISGNSATGGIGGGILNGGTLTLTNSTISGNSVSYFGLGGGGGIFNQGGTVAVTNSTISGNTAEFRGGGIGSNTPGTVRARNTIIALNVSPSSPDVYGPLTSEGFNLIGNSAGATIAPVQFSDQIGVTAAQLNLGPLQDNGGPTQTHALLSGSFAIDKGHSSGPSTDQRGFNRPADNPAIPNVSGGDGSDIGAFEFGGAAASLQILSITRSRSGPVVLEVTGFPYGVHRIQASADLSFGSSIDIATITADAAGRFQFQDTPAGLTKFYRVVIP